MPLRQQLGSYSKFVSSTMSLHHTHTHTLSTIVTHAVCRHVTTSTTHYQFKGGIHHRHHRQLCVFIYLIIKKTCKINILLETVQFQCLNALSASLLSYKIGFEYARNIYITICFYVCTFTCLFMVYTWVCYCLAMECFLYHCFMITASVCNSQ